MKVVGNLVDVHKRCIYPVVINVVNGLIKNIRKTKEESRYYIMPGLIDAHVHIESSMVTPGSFAVASVPHGTIGVVADPHEIANVLGMRGVDYMIEDGDKTPFRFYFGAPSCVPATEFESSGAILGANEIEILLNRKEIKFLAEMMNFPGVINGNQEVIQKITIAKKCGKPVDGHAPGVTGEALRRYINAGISTDHESSTIEEAHEKIGLGMKVIIREGSAARNLEALKSLFNDYPDMIMLGSDDIHPEMLRTRHLEKLAARLFGEGFDIFNVIRSITVNPVSHYSLDAGLLRPGDKADFILVENLEEMNVLETWIDGNKVFDRGMVLFRYQPGDPINNFNCSTISIRDIAIKNMGDQIRVITAFNGELFTREEIHNSGPGQFITQDTGNDILKIIVKDRYRNLPPAVGFIRGFGLKDGAFASSVAHDSHNVIAVGTNDDDIVSAVNEVIKMKGGLSVSHNGKVNSFQLNIGGIMSTRPCEEIALDYEKLSSLVKQLGCTMAAPFMTLSFMALLVIPELKLSDKGLFDGNKFCYVSLFI